MARLPAAGAAQLSPRPGPGSRDGYDPAVANWSLRPPARGNLERSAGCGGQRTGELITALGGQCDTTPTDAAGLWPGRSATLASGPPAQTLAYGQMPAGWNDPSGVDPDGQRPTRPAPRAGRHDAVCRRIGGKLGTSWMPAGWRKAHYQLSRWYDDPNLNPQEQQHLNELLDQLAGTVIYSTQNLMEPACEVQQGETLERIAQRYNVPWQLLAKINGIDDPHSLAARRTAESRARPVQRGDQSGKAHADADAQPTPTPAASRSALARTFRRPKANTS